LVQLKIYEITLLAPFSLPANFFLQEFFIIRILW
jgi:hypothetical protein